MTKAELRVLYVLAKHEGNAKRMQVSHAMARFKATDRERALANLELLELVSSCRVPAPKGKGGTGGLVYWLTEAGLQTVADLIEKREIRDPQLGQRGRYPAIRQPSLQ